MLRDTSRPTAVLWFRPGMFPEFHVLEAWPQPMVLSDDSETSGRWDLM